MKTIQYGVIVFLALGVLSSGCKDNYSLTLHSSQLSAGGAGGNSPNAQAPLVNPSSSPTPSASDSPSPSPSVSPSPIPPENTVCDPFGSGSSSASNNGLVASLTYLPSTSSITTSSTLKLANFDAGAKDVVSENVSVFLSSLSVPTVDFSNGFVDGRGDTLRDLSGNMLIEYFALHINGYLQLNPGDAEGDYQLAILSDDGSIVSLNGNQIINNDGHHSNTLGCATSTVHLVPGMPVPLSVNYFQGPRYRIALTLLWRSGTSLAKNEPYCGVKEGDSFYFTQSSASSTPQPTSNYTALADRGWKTVPAANLYLPSGVANPCAK